MESSEHVEKTIKTLIIAYILIHLYIDKFGVFSVDIGVCQVLCGILTEDNGEKTTGSREPEK